MCVFEINANASKRLHAYFHAKYRVLSKTDIHTSFTSSDQFFFCFLNDTFWWISERVSRPNSGYLHARAWRVLHILQNQVIYVHEHGVRVAYFETFYFTNPYLSFFFESTPNYNCVLSSVCGGDIGVCLC